MVSSMGNDYFYHSEFSDYGLHLYCYILNVSADMSSGPLSVFLVELGNLHGTEEGRRIYRTKRCEYNNKDEDHNPDQICPGSNENERVLNIP